MSPSKIRQYVDYREFLRAHAEESRRTRREWTYGVWARRLGLRDTSSITKILHGQRDAGTRVTERLVEYFAFTPEDAEYFRDLIRLRKVRSDPRLYELVLRSVRESEA